MQLSRRRRDEGGAFAVLFAIMAVLLLTLAALGTDLGNAISRHTDTQNQADFAAFDAGQEFPVQIAAGVAGGTVPSAIVDAVRDSFNNNQPEDDDSPCWRAHNCVSSAQLTNCPAAGCLDDGEVRYTADGLQVVAPKSRVDFGFANVFGASGTSVQSDATVNVFTAGPRVLPLFGVSGCDWGRQVLTDPAHVPAPTVPTLFADGETGPAALTTKTIYDPSNTIVDSVPKDGSGYVLWVGASQWKKTWKIGFFREDGSAPIVVEGAGLRRTDNTAYPLPIDDHPATVSLIIPTTVTANEGLYYVRAWGGKNTVGDSGNKWSPKSEALPMRVGVAILECASDHAGGNFGTLRVPRSGTPVSQNVPLNIAAGLQDPLNLVTHPWGVTQHLPPTGATWNGQCVDGTNGAVVSDEPDHLKKDSNCVFTDPGLTANDATQGFITGVGAVNGLLIKPTKCDRDGGTATRDEVIHHVTYHINNDVLTCFLTGGHSLQEISSPTYGGGAALSADVLNSPRFAWIPILHKAPDNGTKAFSIIDFRPAFITDEDPNNSGSVKGSKTGTTDNGLLFDGDSLEEIKLVFFNYKALPHDGDVPLIDYLGVGDPIVHLID